LLTSIIEFGDTIVREVMVPRPDVVAVESTMTCAAVLERAIGSGLSRIPVYATTIDDITGVAFTRDLVKAAWAKRENEPVSAHARQPRYVPETKRVAPLLREMQREQFHLAIVVDEYGVTAGIVTLEDLIEELVGEITDEYDVEEVPPEKLADGTIVVNARMPVDEVNELLEATELPEGDEWDTVGGLLYSLLGHVPVEGEVAVVDGHRLVAERVQGRRIGRVRISPTGGDPDADSAEAGAPRASHDATAGDSGP
jgi:putative hemolysin